MHALACAASRYAHLAEDELAAALPPGSALRRLGATHWLASGPGRFSDLAAALGHAVFVRHLAPADIEVGLEAGAGCGAVAAALLPAVLPLCAGPAPLQVQVQVLPGGPRLAPGQLAADLRGRLGAAGVAVTGGPAGVVLSLGLHADAAWAGIGPVAANRSPWPGGAARLRAAPGEISRSARKLEEAIELWDLRLPAAGRALDLGAAPGGWTGLLLQRGLAVTAVDAARLAPALAGRAGLTVLRGSVFTVALPPGPFEVLTADLSWDPMRAAAAAVRFRPRLAGGAPGVFTIKFFGGDPRARIAQTVAALRAGGFGVEDVRHLYHDRAEATALLRA